jgi:hypothetical protein
MIASISVVAPLVGEPSAAFAAASCSKPDSYQREVLTVEGGAGSSFGSSVVASDFNHDGFVDIAVGSPNYTIRHGVGTPENQPPSIKSGATTVYSGSASGLGIGRTLLLSDVKGQSDVNGAQFGRSLAAGDFNKDGFPDLAIGGSEGLVVFNGSTNGIGSVAGRIFGGDSDSGPAEPAKPVTNARPALAAGDLNGDGYADLAIGNPISIIREISKSGEFSRTVAGAVTVLTGGAAGLSEGWTLTQPDAGGVNEDGDMFGAALAVGNVTGSGLADLIVGAPGEGLGSGNAAQAKAGEVYVFPGTAGSAHTGFVRNQSGTGGTNEAGDAFGSALAVANLDRSGPAEIIVGVPGETPTAASPSIGAVAVIGGGVTAAAMKAYWIDEASTGDVIGDGDRFGASLATGDSNADGFLDLVVGAPGASRGGPSGSGIAYVFSGHVLAAPAVSTLSPAGRVTQADVLNANGASDGFGTAVALGDVNKDGRADAFFGAPGDSEIQTSSKTGTVTWTRQILRAGGPYDIEPFTPITAVQTTPVGTAVGAVQWAYTDNVGYLRHFTQDDPNSSTAGEWSNSSTSLAVFNGRPVIGQQADGKTVVAVRSTKGQVWVRTEDKSASSNWGQWTNVGGPVIASLAIEKLPDGRLVIFATDVDGALWVLPQVTANGSFGAWLGTGLGGLASEPVLAPIAGGIQIFARDTAGTLRTALFADMAVTGCTAVGDAPIQGTPSVVTYPGSRLQVFARSADDTVVTIGQDSAGAFGSAWSTVPSSDVVGSPAAVLDPASGKITVLARYKSGAIFGAIETRQGSMTWGNWESRTGDGEAAVTDVTVVPYSYEGKRSYLFTFRDEDQDVWVYRPTVEASAQLAKPGAERSFTAEKLPRPPR